MERYARDLIALTDHRHALLHIGEGLAVLEQDGRFLPLSLPLDGWPAFWASLNPDVIHAHFVSSETLALLENVPARPLVLSLHDVGFLHPKAFGQDRALPERDARWIARWREVALRACAVLAPSRFLAELWDSVVPDVPISVLAPGVARPATMAPFGAALKTIGVLGAIGPHKGKAHLLDLIEGPGAERYEWVLIGYTEDQLQPGSIGRLKVHGPFDYADTARWLSEYQVDLVYFPNRIAESFSYALSDAWAAGVPVLAPEVGALGERVRAGGAGALLPAGCAPDAALAMLGRIAADDRLRQQWRSALESGAAPIPTLSDMAAAIAPVYQSAMEHSRVGSADLEALQPYLKSQLDGVVFRSENIRLARDYSQVREWAVKLEGDVLRQQQALSALTDTRAQIEAFAEQQSRQLELSIERVRHLEADVGALRERNAAVEASALDIERDLHAQLARAESLTREVHALAAVRAELEQHQQRLHVELDRVETARAATDAALARLRIEFEQRFEQAERARAQITAEHDALRIANAHLQLSVERLETEIAPLRIKGARYDRVLGWIPAPLRALLRRLKSLRKA